MKGRHLNTDFRMFILERINNVVKNPYKKEIEEVEPDDLDLDDTHEEPIEDETDPELEYEEIDPEEESQDEDDLIDELHRKYKNLKRLYEYRLHQRKSR